MIVTHFEQQDLNNSTKIFPVFFPETKLLKKKVLKK